MASSGRTSAAPDRSPLGSAPCTRAVPDRRDGFETGVGPVLSLVTAVLDAGVDQ